MAAPTIQVRRGTAAQVAAVTPAAGEPVWTTDTKVLYLGDGSTAGGVQVGGSGAAVSRVFLVNNFLCPAPGTEWTPTIKGVELAANKTSAKFWIPLDFLKIGDIITTYKIVGDAVKVAGDTVTFDCKLVQVNKADPITTTDITSGGIVQVAADGNFDVAANCDDTTVATDKQYLLECVGTNSNVSTTEHITVIGVEITVTRL
jgi:hypothetical protein